MTTFTIDSDNNITVHSGLPAGTDESQSFSTQKELAKLAADWPASRLVDTWNSFAGRGSLPEDRSRRKVHQPQGSDRPSLEGSRAFASLTSLTDERRLAPVKRKRKKAVQKKSAEAARRADPRKPPGQAQARERQQESRSSGPRTDVQRRFSRQIMELTGWAATRPCAAVGRTLIKKTGPEGQSRSRTDREGARTYRIK